MFILLLTRTSFPRDCIAPNLWPEATGCSLNIVFFPLNVGIFLNSANSAAALVFYLPYGGPSVKSGVHLLISREKRESPESGIYSKSSEKTHPVYRVINPRVQFI